MHHPNLRTLAALLIATLGLAACGDSGNSPLIGGAGSSTSSSGGSSGLTPAACPYTPPPVVAGASEVPCSARSDPRVKAMSDDGIALTSSLGLPLGRYALPTNQAPTQLVVFFHGHQNDSCSWRNHLRAVAARGAVAVAMNYSDQSDRVVPPYGLVENWGWAVRSGTRDSIAAARYFLDRYPSITQVFNFGASMGGNASGYAIYDGTAKRANCAPLWDYWVVTEGVHNLTEEYTGTRTLAPVLVAAAQAQKEIEEENGGTLEAKTANYSAITNTLHADGMNKLKGVVLTHGTNDQTVPFDQSNQMANALRAQGVPAYLFAVTGSDHVWEGSSTAQVMKVGLDELYRLMAGGTVSNGQGTVAGP